MMMVKTIQQDCVKLSRGNDKIGNITNLSLLPIVTCDKSMPCAKCKQCYAWRFSCRPSVHEAWKHNTILAENNVDKFFESIYYQMQVNIPRYFRWHVGGDCPSKEYVKGVVELAEMIPETNFLIFSKRYEWWSKVLESRPQPTNLSVILSAWVGVKLHNPLQLPVAWVYNPHDPDFRIPTSADNCPGNCRECHHCWNEKQDVLFKKH
jgi:hypothetical protein